MPAVSVASVLFFQTATRVPFGPNQSISSLCPAVGACSQTKLA